MNTVFENCLTFPWHLCSTSKITLLQNLNFKWEVKIIVGNWCFFLFTLPIIPKSCIHVSIVFNFSWDDCNTQEKLETLVIQNFFEGRGLNKVYYEQCENGELSFLHIITLFRGRKMQKIGFSEFWYDM